MSGKYPYVIRYKYPHMIEEEKSVWDRFVVKYPDFFETVDYDFRVGKGQEPIEDFAENYNRMAQMLSQHRIDVLGWEGDEPTIVEVKGRALLATIGQLQGYKVLFEKSFPVFGPASMMCVCASMVDDVRDVFMKLGIPYFIV